MDVQDLYCCLDILNIIKDSRVVPWTSKIANIFESGVKKNQAHMFSLKWVLKQDILLNHHHHYGSKLHYYRILFSFLCWPFQQLWENNKHLFSLFYR